MSANSTTLKGQLFHATVLSCAIAGQTVLALLRKIRLMFLYLRRNVIKRLQDPQPYPPKRPKVLAVIAHITSPSEARDRQRASAKIEKLSQTIDGLLASFAHCELTIFSQYASRSARDGLLA